MRGAQRRKKIWARRQNFRRVPSVAIACLLGEAAGAVRLEAAKLAQQLLHVGLEELLWIGLGLGRHCAGMRLERARVLKATRGRRWASLCTAALAGFETAASGRRRRETVRRLRWRNFCPAAGSASSRPRASSAHIPHSTSAARCLPQGPARVDSHLYTHSYTARRISAFTYALSGCIACARASRTR
jgi:hypothetical protein